jgi:RHS repeat-associated protein
LGEAFEPSLNTGGASYSVNFALPAGPAGHTPSLALNYSSGFSAGVAGLGWKLSIPTIERSLENGQPSYSDNDVLSYQGETLVPLTDGTYAPSLQNGFVRAIKSDNGFVINDKSGNTHYFGSEFDEGSESIVGSEGPAFAEFNGTFRWYLIRSTDAKGQQTRYSYTRPSATNGKIYLKSVAYGTPGGAENRVVFEYEDRDDSFYSLSQGFRIQTEQRLTKVSVYHGPRLLWSYSLDYEINELHADRSSEALNSGLSLLSKVTRWNANESVSLPPIRFEYTHIYSQDKDLEPLGNFPGPEDIDINRNGALDEKRLAELQGLTAGVNVIGQQASFTDVTGDALPDWLFWKSGQYQFARNMGYVDGGSHIQFSPAVSLNHAPVAPMDDPAVHIIDLDGDGAADFLHRTSSERWIYYRNRGNGEFSPGVAYPVPATIVPGTEGVQFADVNNDSRIDIVSGSGRYWRYCLNGASQSVSGAYGGNTYDQDLAPFDNFPSAEDIDLNGNGVIDLPNWVCSGSIQTRLPVDINLANSSVKFEDVNGDRIKDAVWLRNVNGSLFVQYWPGTGLLGFAEPVAVLNGPELSGLIDSKFTLQDVNGDGLADLVYQHPGQVRFWLQKFSSNGASWSEEQALQAPSYSANDTALMSGDINGNGTQDFIWVSVSSDQVPQYLDVSGDQKANILRTIDNGMGLRTRLDYQSMGAMQAEANVNGMPWTTSSPLAQQIVSQRTYLLPIDTTGSGDTDTIVQTYKYRDAYYDPYRKQFRGFAFAEVQTLGDTDEATQISRHFFYTGAPDGQDNDGDGLIDERELDGTTEELPLKGKTVKLEQTNRSVGLASHESAQPNQLVQSSQTGWKIQRIHTMDSDVASMSGKEVSFPEKSTETIFYHEFTNSGEISRKDHTYDNWGNLVETYDYGLLSDLQDDKKIESTFAVHPNGIFHLPASSTVTDSDGERLQSSKTYYDNLSLQQLSRGLPTKLEKWKSDNDWIVQQSTQYDQVGNPILIIDPDGRRRQLVWDSTWGAFPVEEWIYADGIGNTPLRIKAGYDTGLGVLTSHTGFNGEQTSLTYDSFGRLLSIQKPYENSPSINYSYHFIDPYRQHEYMFSSANEGLVANNTDTTSYVHTTMARDDGRNEEVKLHIDGLGRELATYTRYEQGYVVTGSKWFDNQGRERKTFRPWTTSLPTYVLPTDDLISTDLYLDAHGRPLKQVLPADEQGRRSVVQYQYLSREVITTDALGYQSKQTLNAEDKVLTLSQQQDINGSLSWFTSEFLYDPIGRLTQITDAYDNIKKQRFNGLDQKIWQSDLDQGVTQYRYNNSGNLTQKTDQLGRTLYYRYDQAARLKLILDNEYRELYQYHYDRPQSSIQQTGYLGKLTWIDEHDPNSNGPVNSEHYHYDLRGNLIHKTRQLDNINYQFHYQYDTQDRLRRQIWPDGDHVDYKYDLRGNLKAIGDIITDVSYHPDGRIAAINYANGTEQSRDYDSKGQLTELESDGNDTLALLSYRYDLRGNMLGINNVLSGSNSQTFTYDAISQLKTATGAYGQLRYQYDAIGNMTAKNHDQSGISSLHQLGDMAYGSGAGREGRTQKGAMPGPHAITSASDGRFWKYNALGQRTEDYAGNRFKWDQLGRLTRWQKTSESSAVENPDILAQEDYRYDYKGRRLQKTSKKLDGNGQLTNDKTAYYVDKTYEVRDDIAQKHISIGNLRVARLQTPIAQALAQIHEYSLNPGWNQIFLKRTPEGGSVWNQLQAVDSQGAKTAGIRNEVRQLLHFDAESKGYTLYQDRSGSLTSLRGNQAYWIKLTSNPDIQYPFAWVVRADASYADDDNLERFAKRLSAGWNHTRLPMDQTLNNKNDIDRFVAATAIERIWWYQQAENRWYSWIKGQDQNTLTQLSPDAIYWVYSTREQIIARASGINSERFFLHNNHLGSVAFETNVDGDITESSNYQPYGSAKANSQQSYEKVGTYSFSGKEQDGSGLYYFEARYYDPVTTRFISPDPLFAVEMEKCLESIIECNLYQYTGNNPVVFVDLSGRVREYQQKVGNTIFNLKASQMDEIAAVPTQEAEAKAFYMHMELALDITPDGETVYLSTHGNHNKEYFDAVKAKFGDDFSTMGAAVKVIPFPATRVGGTIMEGAGLTIKGLYSDNITNVIIEEAAGKLGSKVGLKALQDKVEAPTITQKNATELLGGEIFENTMKNFTQMPREITPANQFDPQE